MHWFVETVPKDAIAAPVAVVLNVVLFGPASVNVVCARIPDVPPVAVAVGVARPSAAMLAYASEPFPAARIAVAVGVSARTLSYATTSRSDVSCAGVIARSQS